MFKYRKANIDDIDKLIDLRKKMCLILQKPTSSSLIGMPNSISHCPSGW